MVIGTHHEIIWHKYAPVFSQSARQFIIPTLLHTKVAVDLYRRVTEPDSELETARAEVIANVANYVKAHPRARPHEIQQYVEGQIAVFKTKIK